MDDENEAQDEFKKQPATARRREDGTIEKRMTGVNTDISGTRICCIRMPKGRLSGTI